MSSRIAFADWQLLFPIIGFAVFFAVFALVVIRVLRMKRPSVDHLQNLPLQDEKLHRASDAR